MKSSSPIGLRRGGVAIISIGLILALSGCVAPRSDEEIWEDPCPEQESIATQNCDGSLIDPSTAEDSSGGTQAIGFVESDFPVTDEEGYTFIVDLLFYADPFTSVVTDAKPGFTDAIATVSPNSAQITNTTSGRTAEWTSSIFAVLLYPTGSVVCDLDFTMDREKSENGQEVSVESGPNTGAAYCAGPHGMWLDADWVNPIETGATVTLQPGSTIDNAEANLEVLGVAEADIDAVLAELNAPVATVVYVDGRLDQANLATVTGGCALRNRDGQAYYAIFDPSGRICG